MSPQETTSYKTERLQPDDVVAGFRCGKRPLDDFFARHALANDRAGICRVYVLRRCEADPPILPPILGFYTLSMASVPAASLTSILREKLPRYPLPVALIGRLAVDEQAQGRRLGEVILLDALRRALDAAEVVGCMGVIVDAKDESAERFYAKYDFETISRPRAGRIGCSFRAQRYARLSRTSRASFGRGGWLGQYLGQARGGTKVLLEFRCVARPSVSWFSSIVGADQGDALGTNRKNSPPVTVMGRSVSFAVFPCSRPRTSNDWMVSGESPALAIRRYQ
jgi:GNAT superfamily N-acetyltransferase